MVWKFVHSVNSFGIVNGINAKMRFLAQTKGRREKERERKRKGRGRERKRRERSKGKEKGKGKLEVKLWQKRKKIANAPAGNRTWDPSKRG